MSAATIFYVERVPAAGESIVLDGDEGHHAARVLRMRAGEPLMVCDGAGEVGDGEIAEVGRDNVRIAVARRWSEPSIDPRVTVVQALPKSDRSELAVELAVEAGADRIVPWQAQRCVARWDAGKAEKGQRRWEAVARAASRQSRRAFLPDVTPPLSTAALARLVAERADGEVVLMLHESATQGLGSMRDRLVAAPSVTVIVGPEGGIADEECSALAAAGAAAVRLGPTVLRTSTAAAVALGALGALTDRWSNGPLRHEQR